MASTCSALQGQVRTTQTTTLPSKQPKNSKVGTASAAAANVPFAGTLQKVDARGLIVTFRTTCRRQAGEMRRRAAKYLQVLEEAQAAEVAEAAEAAEAVEVAGAAEAAEGVETCQTRAVIGEEGSHDVTDWIFGDGMQTCRDAAFEHRVPGSKALTDT